MPEQPVAGHGHRVRLEPVKKGEQEPPGVWRCLDRSPEPASWWVQPVDEDARRWLAAPGCPLRPVQGCVEYPARAMRPPDVAALF
jgi:hypothetical protein